MRAMSALNLVRVIFFATVYYTAATAQNSIGSIEANNNSTVFIGHPDSFEDGDSFWIGIHKVRLHGIDAPEPKQLCGDIHCGQEALQYLKKLATEKIFRCKVHLGKGGKPWIMYGRYVVTCKAGETNVNEKLVQVGWALASDKSYGEYYRKIQKIAEMNGAGMHSTRFTNPWDWRKLSRKERCSSNNIASAIPLSINRLLSVPMEQTKNR